MTAHQYVLTDRIGTTATSTSLAGILGVWRLIMVKYPEFAPLKVRRVASPTDKEG